MPPYGLAEMLASRSAGIQPGPTPDPAPEATGATPPADPQASSIAQFIENQRQQPNATAANAPTYQPGSDVSSSFINPTTPRPVTTPVKQMVSSGVLGLLSNFTTGFGEALMHFAGVQTPLQRAKQMNDIQESQLNQQEHRMRMEQMGQMVTLPNGTSMPAPLAMKLYPTLIKEQGLDRRAEAKQADPVKDLMRRAIEASDAGDDTGYKALLQKIKDIKDANTATPRVTSAEEDSRWLAIRQKELLNQPLTPEEATYKKAWEDRIGKKVTEPKLAAASVFTGPRWAQVAINKTALDMRIKQELGMLPSGDIKQRGQFSAELLPHVATLRSELELADAKGLLGPLIGRGAEFMAGKIGSTGDPETDAFYNKLRSDLHLFASGMNRAHFGGRAGIETLKYFEDLIGNAFRSKEAINGTLDTSTDYLTTYASATPGFGQGVDVGGYKLPPIHGTQGSQKQATHVFDPATGKIRPK